MGLKNISLSIPEGAFVVIAGMNGSGKTTLLQHLNGLLLPTSGTVYLSGMSVSENLARSRQMVGMVFQDADSQIVCETVFDDVAFGPENLRLEHGEVEQRVIWALRTVGLFDLKDKSPHLLSGGKSGGWPLPVFWPWNPKCSFLTSLFPAWIIRVSNRF